MNRQCHAVLTWTLLFMAMIAPWATAQSAPDQSDAERGRPAFLSPPSKELVEKGLQPLSSSLPDVSLRPGLRPVDVSEGVFQTQESPYAVHQGDGWVPIRYHWIASDLRHRPLYFEDAMLERHGQSRRPVIQPLASGARFFLTFPVLPYAMTVDPPCRERSTLGHFRPGSGAPCLLQRPPLQTDAGLVEAGVWVGLIFLIP